MYELFIGIDPSITGSAVSIVSPNLHKIDTTFFTETQKYGKAADRYQFFHPFVVPKG
jgi:hypothetical protein